MSGWLRNNKIAAILIIEVEVVYPKCKYVVSKTVRKVTILLFRKGDKIIIILLNSQLLFQTYNQNNISTIRNSITFYYPHANLKITIVSLSSFTILNSFIIILFLARSKHSTNFQNLFVCHCRPLNLGPVKVINNYFNCGF
jgi:hypothetical protein